MALLFNGVSWLVMPWWALMLLAPRWSVTQRLLGSPLVGLLPALLYVGLIIPRLDVLLPAVAQPQLSSIAALLSTPAGATIAWIHMLAFDLMIGRWIFLDSLEWQLSHWLRAPLLVLTILFGPAGFAAYVCLRQLLRGTRMRAKRRSALSA